MAGVASPSRPRAQLRGVQPSWSTAFTFAPEAIKARAASRWPLAQAQISAVMPLLVAAFTSAPAANSALTMPAWPRALVPISGVQPVSSRASTLPCQPSSITSHTRCTSLTPVWQAWWSRVHPSPSRLAARASRSLAHTPRRSSPSLIMSAGAPPPLNPKRSSRHTIGRRHASQKPSPPTMPSTRKSLSSNSSWCSRERTTRPLRSTRAPAGAAPPDEDEYEDELLLDEEDEDEDAGCGRACSGSGPRGSIEGGGLRGGRGGESVRGPTRAFFSAHRIFAISGTRDARRV